jgi:hypothetical protein
MESAGLSYIGEFPESQFIIEIPGAKWLNAIRHQYLRTVTKASNYFMSNQIYHDFSIIIMVSTGTVPETQPDRCDSALRDGI